MIAGRALKGIGAAAMIPGSLALIARAYPRADRGRAIGIWAAASALTTALGPILGGVALGLGGPEVWRLLFAINLPLGALALWLLWRHVREDPPGRPTPLDWPGALLISVALALLAYGLTGGGPVDYRPLSAAALFLRLVPLARGAHPRPDGPARAFPRPRLRGGESRDLPDLLRAVHGAVLPADDAHRRMGHGGGPRVRRLRPALRLHLDALGALGRLADRYGPGRLIGAGGLIVALSFAGLALGVGTQDVWVGVFPATALMGLGMALVVAPLSTAIMTSLPEERSGTASGINNAVSRVAGLIAVAVMGGLAAKLYAGAGGTASFGAFSDSAGHAAAMTRAFAGLAWITAVLTGIGAALSWVLIPRPEAGRA
jgi:MFS family permease